MKSIFRVLGLLVFCFGSVASGETIHQVGPDCVLKTDDATWTVSWASFDQDKVVSFGDYQYALYWDEDCVLTLVRRDLRTNKFQPLRLEDHVLAAGLPKEYRKDGHRNVVLGISPGDGRIHLSWGHHNNNLNYTRSVEGFVTSPPATITAAHFEPEQPLAANEPRSVTYPRFVNDHQDNLYFFCRNGIAGDGDIAFFEYDAEHGKWSLIANQLLSSKGFFAEWGEEGSHNRSAYMHDLLFDGKGRLHLTWIWREWDENPDDETRWHRCYGSNHDLNYAYSDDCGRTWKNNGGVQIADTRRGEKISIESDGIVVWKIPVFSWMLNQCAMTLDSHNNPHVATLHMEEIFKPADLQTMTDKLDPTQRYRQNYYHYWRGEDGAWHRSKALTQYEYHARPAIVAAPDDTIIIYFQTGGEGIRCHTALAADDWAEWRTAQLAGPEYTYTDASKPDRRRLREHNILSITADPRAQMSGRGFAFIDVGVQRLTDVVFRAADPSNFPKSISTNSTCNGIRSLDDNVRTEALSAP